MQTNIFTPILCAICGLNPGVKPNNPILWDGFFDADAAQAVCTNCKEDHYLQKQNAELSGLYSEMPLMAEPHPTVAKYLNTNQSKK